MVIHKVFISEIQKFIGKKIVRIFGDYDGVYIDNLADRNRVNNTTLDWVNSTNLQKQQLVINSPAKVILVDESVNPVDGKVLIVVKNPKVILAEIGNYFFVKSVAPGIHSTAIIDPKAYIGENVFIGAYTVIGKCKIGDNCRIDSQVNIYDDVIIGNDCVIKAGAIIGGEGFGYEKDEDGNTFRFPQIGQVIIGHHVEIGSNTCIDRGALADTVIGDYTKINNLCHIAHNNIIGKNVEITGCCNISGSNVIDDNVWIAPNSSIRGWLHIGEGATIGMGAVVVKNVPAREIWVGNPAHKLEKK